MPPSTPPARRRTPWAALTIIVILTLGAAIYLLWPTGARTLQTGVLLKQPRAVPAFTLHTADGTLTPADFTGHWTLLFTGYTHCPDVCPTTLTALARVFAALGTDRGRIRLWFISVDPERDPPTTLQAYAHAFDADFIGATAPVPQLKTLGHALGFAFSYGPPIKGDANDYEVSHSAAIMLIDPQGRLAGYFSPPIQVQPMAADLRHIIHGNAVDPGAGA